MSNPVSKNSSRPVPNKKFSLTPYKGSLIGTERNPTNGLYYAAYVLPNGEIERTGKYPYSDIAIDAAKLVIQERIK